jgi:glycosyltransferase involved in cell wall biosynthesis
MASVTVVIPTFNRHGLLLEALSSVFAQSFQDYKLVVVDDGSTDGTHAVLEPFATRLRYISKPHGGEASARNRGVREADTGFIAFLDSDDLWEPEFLSATMSHFTDNPQLGLVSTGCVLVPDGARRPRFRTPLLQGDLFATLFWRNFIAASTVVVRRECLDTVGLFDETLDQATDYDLWLRIARKYPIAVLNRPLCRWRRHEGNVSHQELRHRQCVLRVIESHCHDGRISRRQSRLRRSRLNVSLGRAYLKLGRTIEAEKCFREAIALTPFRIRPLRYLATGWFMEKGRALLSLLNKQTS